MATMKRNLEMVKGTTKTIRGFLTNESGVPIDDAGAVYKLTLRATPNAADPPLFETNGSQYQVGEGRCTIGPGDTSFVTYDRVVYWEMKVTETNGTKTVLGNGTLTIYMNTAR